jgi:tRNA nucleotidyltransferase (CCA-adding enzyme)
VYLVGGPVRDVLMGMPIKDLDFVVEGDAPHVASQLAEQLAGQVVVHSTFGTASVILEDAHIDLVTARREIYPRPGALPQVTPSGIDDDLSRRDFTINALAALRPGEP